MTEITWAEVQTGDLIEASNGVRWLVHSHDLDGTIRLEYGDTVSVGTPKPDGKVKLVQRLSRAGATELAAQVLQASLLADRDNDHAPWRVPKVIADLGTFRAHLFMLHGTWAEDQKDRKQLEQTHRLLHEDASPLPGYQKHQHI